MKQRWIWMAVWVGWTASALAAPLASWELDALSGSEPVVEATAWADGLSKAPALQRGNGATPVAYINSFALRDADATSLTEAIRLERYLSVDLATRNPGGLYLASLMARFQAQDARDHAATVVLMSDRTGLTDGSPPIATWQVGGLGNTDGWMNQVRVVTLSDIPALQGVDEVSFRFYFFSQQSPYTQVGIGRAFQVNGTTDLLIEGGMGAPVAADTPIPPTVNRDTPATAAPADSAPEGTTDGEPAGDDEFDLDMEGW